MAVPSLIEPWTIESDPSVQTAVGALGSVLGLVVTVAAWRLTGAWTETTVAAFALGLLVLAVSLVVLIQGGKQIVAVDPVRRRVEIVSSSRWGERRRAVHFDDVEDLFLGELGDREGGSISYYVGLRLRSGDEVHLFVGAFEGVYHRPTMEARLQRLQQYVRRES